MASPRALLLASAVLGFASATGPSSSARSVSRSAVLSAISAPAIGPIDFECGWRGLAYEYAQQLQPFRPAAAFAAIHDGLELSALCNQSFVAPAAAAAAAVAAPAAAASAATTLYVDFVAGSDANPGTQALPLQHVSFAVVTARGLPAPRAIILRDGVHRLSETLALDTRDSGLSIAAFPGESPVISSGIALKTTWAAASMPAPAAAPVRPAAGTASSRAAPAPNCTWTTFATEDSMYDDWPSPNVRNLSSTASAAACEALCVAQVGGVCNSWTWFAPAGAFGAIWDGMCFARTDALWSPTEQHDTFSGYCVSPPVVPNVWVADLGAAGTPLPASMTASDDWVLTLLFSADGGRSTQRAIRARYPNADPERDLFPTGWASGGARGRLPCNASDSNVTHVPLPGNYGPAEFSDYYFGQGGPCERFGAGEWLNGPPSVSYWCQPNGRTAGCQYFVNSPVNISLTAAQLPNGPAYAPDAAANGAVFQYWRQGHWFSLMTRVAAVAALPGNGTALSWGYGAFQGAEGDAEGEDWYIEHVHAELDAPREFFFEAASQRLFFFHNASAGTPPPPAWTFEVPALPVLVSVTGTPAAPVTGVSLAGITFTSAAASYLMAHGIPSGGDWGLSRVGAILVAGAEALAVTGCTFTRLDGNAIFLSGYNRNVTIDRNEFVWLGESAVASWGFTDGADASAGTQPWYTTVTNNLCHEIGMFEKQVSCYFAATSYAATISHNIFFNMPRASINFNDDMAGGTLMTRNLVWNTCRESQDHGAFNSWGRVPYLFQWPNGTSAGGLKVQDDEISFNFLVAGGGANGGALDHDDGSSFYHDHDNFEVYSGKKSDFDGHAKVTYNNIFAYANVYGSKCVGIMNLPHAAPNTYFAEGFYNNKCVLDTANAPYLDLGSGCAADGTLASRMLLGNNSIFAPNASASISCGKSYTFPEWAALGFDAGSTIADVPDTPTIMGWARALLGIAAA